jgi:Eukaryotic membrane protein family
MGDGTGASTGAAYRSLDDIQRKNVLSTGNSHEQHILSSLDRSPSAHQLGPYQLPSPEVSPSSSRSSSPSPEMTDSSSAEFDTFKNSQSGYRKSESFGYVADTQNEDTAEVTLHSQRPTKNLQPLNLHDITEETPRKTRKTSITTFKSPDEKVLKLSPLEIKELTGAPESLPTLPITRAYVSESGLLTPSPVFQTPSEHPSGGMAPFSDGKIRVSVVPSIFNRPGFTTRAISTPVTTRLEPLSPQTGPDRVPVARATSYIHNNSPQVDREMRRLNLRPEASELDLSCEPQPPKSASRTPSTPAPENLVSPVPPEIPIPPMSIPTYLQLELASSRPSPLYIYRSPSSEYPYESSKIKFERLLNFLLLPPQLEQVLGFGALACLDAWLYTFTILPLRFIKAAAILVQFWCTVLACEAHYIAGFIYHGSGRMWHRQRGRGESTENRPVSRSASRSRPPITANSPRHTLRSPSGSASNGTDAIRIELERRLKSNSKWGPKHKRTKSQPSALSSYHKADLLQGSVIICSCMILMCFDASRMYHSIRGQSAIKLYMVWSVLEVSSAPFYIWLSTKLV